MAPLATRRLGLALVAAVPAVTWSVQLVAMPYLAGSLAIGREDAAAAGGLFLLCAARLVHGPGVVVDRWGDVVALRLGTIVSAVAALAVVVSPDLTGLLLARAAADAGAALIAASALPWALADAGRLAVASGTAFATALVAPLLAGCLADEGL